MIRDKWSVALRNDLQSLAMKVECAACYEATLTSKERKQISDKLRELVNYIDNKIKF